MSIPEPNNLFHSSDSQEILNYILSRLQEGDLSSEEALAILSAVHADLGKGSSANPKIYQSYTSVMKSLQQSMPEVYDYVVSTWGQERNSESKDLGVQYESFDDDAGEVKPKNIAAGPEKDFNVIKIEEEIDDSEESPEAEESRESKIDLAVKVKEKNDESGLEETEEEVEEDERQEKEDKAEDAQESNEANEDESVAKVETRENEESETDLSEEETEVEQNDSETIEESASEEAGKESIAESENVESNGEAGAEEEIEWPEIEQPLPEEPSEGFSGEEDPTPED